MVLSSNIELEGAMIFDAVGERLSGELVAQRNVTVSSSNRN
jgi:hypothetical protein